MNSASTQHNHDEIAILAYQLSESPKGKHRSPDENWLEAERMLAEKQLEALTKDTTKLKPKKAPKRASQR